MSHEIMEHDVQEGIEQAWHGLTTVNPELSLENCWLRTWDYVEKPIVVDGKPSRFAILGVTDDATDILNPNNPESELNPRVSLTVGKSFSRHTFKPVFNAKLIELLDKATKGKDMRLVSDGTVMQRGRQFLSFALGDSYRSGGREFKPFFNIGNGNDMSSPLWQNISNTCTVCNNTFQMNMGQAGLIQEVKKTKYSELVLADFSKAARVMLAGQKEFAEMFDALAVQEVTEEAARQFLVGFFHANKQNTPLATKTANNVDAIVKLFHTGAGNEGKNLADLFSALTDFYTHLSASAQGDTKANWKNFVSSEFGSAREEKQRAWMLINVDGERTKMRKLGMRIMKLTAEKAAADAALAEQQIAEAQEAQAAAQAATTPAEPATLAS